MNPKANAAAAQALQERSASLEPADAAARLVAAAARLDDARAEARRLEAARQALEQQARSHPIIKPEGLVQALLGGTCLRCPKRRAPARCVAHAGFRSMDAGSFRSCGVCAMVLFAHVMRYAVVLPPVAS